MKTVSHSHACGFSAARQATLPCVIAGLVALGMSCGRTPSSADRPDRPKEVADAARLVDLGQCEAAVDKLKAFVSAHPDDKEAYLVLGDAWTCRGFVKAKTAGRADAAALQEADRAYVSMLKLSPEDIRPLVSSGAVEAFLGDAASASGHLAAARKADGKNAAALNLSALAIGSDPAKKRQETQSREGAAASDTPAWLQTLSDGYALRKGPDTVGVEIPRVCTASGCARGVFVETATIDGQPYPAGTVTDVLRETEGKLIFLDRVHPSRKPGQGWVLHAGPNHAPLSAPIGSRTIVTSLPPARPFPDGHVAATLQETQAITDWERSWGWYSRSERDVPAYLSALGPVNGDIVPGSVKVVGPLQYLGGPPKPGAAPGSSVFTPVSYEEFVYDERAVDPKVVARVTVPERDAAIIVRSPFLSAAEKRALLVGILAPGTPLAIGLRVRGSSLQQATLALRDGEVTVVVPAPGGEDTYVNGELRSTTLPFKNPDGASGR